MSRGLSSPNVTASTSLHVRPIVFAKFAFDSVTEYVHNGVGSYTFGGNTYQGIGALGEVGTLEEGLDLSPFGVTMRLNALDSTLLNIAATEEVFNRRVTLYIGLLDENGVLVDTPAERWSGWMDSLSVELGGGADGIAMQAESDLRFFDRTNGARFTDEDQQARYSGDVMFQYLAQMIDAQIIWGPGGERVYFGGKPTQPAIPPGVYNNPYVPHP